MTWLVLASEQDASARWAAEQLQMLGLSPLTFVTDTDLAGAIWRHQVGNDVARTVVELADGRVIDTRSIHGTLNRLSHVPPGMVAGIAFDDRSYAHQEISALVLSWLAALPGPVVNSATPRGLCGAWRSPAEWALLAHEAGLEARPISWPPEEISHLRGWSYLSPGSENSIVIGKAVFSENELSADTISACIRLAELASTSVLGLSLDDVTLTGVTPLPDLRSGGQDLIAALAHVLEGQ